MAVDTAAKRGSLMRWGRPYLYKLIPDGTIDQGDRQTLALYYGGILSDEPVIPPEPQAYIRYDAIVTPIKYHSKTGPIKYDL